MKIENVKEFITNVREISLVTHREYIKFRLIEVLKETILTVIPEGMKKQHKINVLEI